MALNRIVLTYDGMYKDGGSKRYIDSKGNEYWRCFKFGEKYKSIKGVIFIGNINDKNPIKAKGIFELVEKNKMNSLVNQL